VNPQWTAPQWTDLQRPDGSLAGPPSFVEKPLSGVLGETWQEYRRHAARLLPLATAGIVVAGAATELVRLAADRFNPLVALLLELPAAWLVIKLVEFLLGAVAAGLIQETRVSGGAPGFRPARLRECLGEVTTVWLVTSFAVVGAALFFLIPGIYLAIMWSVCVPVIVIERVGPRASLGRSRQLISGHGWSVFGRLLALSLMESVASSVLRGAFFWLPPAWQLLVENGIMYIVFIPAAVVMSTLIYYRLVAAEAADEAVARAAVGT
jgi:hypothetical protein